MTPLEIESALAAGAALSNVKHAAAGTNPFVALPNTYQVHDLEKFLAAPLRAKGQVLVHDTESFVELFDQLRSDVSRIYFDQSKNIFTAVLNDTIAGEPGWRDHRIVYQCPLSDEWATWTGVDGAPKGQQDFANFVENNVRDITSPDAATALEISRTIEAKKSVNFASSIRLANGATEFVYEEQVAGTAAKGKIAVPELFKLAIPVLRGGAHYEVQARLRYRIKESHLVLWFDLVSPKRILEDAIGDVRKAIALTTKAPLINGQP